MSKFDFGVFVTAQPSLSAYTNPRGRTWGNKSLARKTTDEPGYFRCGARRPAAATCF